MYCRKSVETEGYTLPQGLQKWVLGLDCCRHALYTRKKKKTKLNGWEEPREHDKRCGFSFGVDLAENMDVALGGKLCLPFIGGLGGVVPHNFCTTSDIDNEDPTCFCLPQAWIYIFDYRVLITLCASQRELCGPPHVTFNNSHRQPPPAPLVIRAQCILCTLCTLYWYLLLKPGSKYC